MTATVTKEQLKAIHALLPTRIKGDPEEKAEFVVGFTGESELHSTTNLTFDQANDMIAFLGGKKHTYDHWAIFNSKNSQHLYIMSLLIQMGCTHYDINFQKHLADMVRLSEFLKSVRSPVRKKLKDMNAGELSKIITALESMFNKDLKRV